MDKTSMCALWEKHLDCEFATRDTEATLATRVEGAYVNHVPVLTGGVGMGYFLTLGHLEKWAPMHPTHLAIFARFLTIVREYGKDLKLKLWQGFCTALRRPDFAYLNCHHDTGLLPYFSSTEITKQDRIPMLTGTTISAFAPGRGAVITGAASGIGLATARQLVAFGMRVCIADRDRTTIEKAMQELASTTVS